MNRFLAGYIFLAISAVSFAVFFYMLSKRYEKIEVPVQENTAEQKEIVPTKIEINSLQIALPIQIANMENGKWKFSGEGAFYLEESPLPGEKGNSIIFGHNFPNVFGQLYKLKTGDTFTISFNDDTTKTFEVKSKFNVTPDQTHILNPTDDTRLTLYTCSGFLDLKRLVITATPVN